METNILEIDSPLYMLDSSNLMAILEMLKWDSGTIVGMNVIMKNDLPHKIYITFSDIQAKTNFKEKFIGKKLLLNST